VGAGDARVSALRFQHVLVDECTQASEPEALIPLVLGAKQVSNVDTCRLAIAHVPFGYVLFDTPPGRWLAGISCLKVFEHMRVCCGGW
jgi:hypothetical protein